MTTLEGQEHSRIRTDGVVTISVLATLVIAGYAAFATHHPGWIAAAVAAAFATGCRVGARPRQASGAG